MYFAKGIHEYSCPYRPSLFHILVWKQIMVEIQKKGRNGFNLIFCRQKTKNNATVNKKCCVSEEVIKEKSANVLSIIMKSKIYMYGNMTFFPIGILYIFLHCNHINFLSFYTNLHLTHLYIKTNLHISMFHV